MPRRRIREFHAKQLLAIQAPKLGFQIQALLVTRETDFTSLASENEWLRSSKLACKPDNLFGKRQQHGLTLLDATLDQVTKFIDSTSKSQLVVDSVTGIITHFIIEPFVPHSKEDEYYFNISLQRNGTRLQFGRGGGEGVEANMTKMPTLDVDIDGDISATPVAQSLCGDVPPNFSSKIVDFICAAYKAFEDLEFTTLEFNPIVFLPPDGKPAPLDLKVEVDHASWFRNAQKWGDIEFPRNWGLHYPEEEYVSALDAKSSSSLRLLVLNPSGRIWCIVAGGGASMVFADTVDHLGMANELGNFGEYGGNPNEEETYNFARTVLQLATANSDDRGRVLLVGGGIANFTDISITFKGIAHAIREYQEPLKQAKARIYVRRAGPNYLPALKTMRELADETGLSISVFGPELPMTAIVPMAVEYLKSIGSPKNSSS